MKGRYLLLIILLSPVSLYSQLATNAPWSMFHNNNRHSGQTNTEVLGPAKNPVIKWSYPVGWNTSYTKPVIGKDNTVYFPARYRLYAITNGKRKWEYDTIGFRTINNSISIGADDTVYVGSQDHLQAIDPDDGSLKWQCDMGGVIYSSPSIDKNNTIYIGCDDNNFYAITNGAVKWTNKLGGAVRSTPAIGADGVIYVGCNDDKLYAISTNGSLQWTNRLGGDIYSSPAIGPDNTVYVGCDDDKLYAITNGRIKWTNRTGGDIRSSPAIGGDGTVYISSLDQKVYAYNSDGTLKWTNMVGDMIYASPVVDTDNTIYIVSADGFVSAFTNGALKWKKPLNTLIQYSTPAIDDQGVLYVARYNTILYAIEGNNEPQLVWSSNTGFSNDGVEPDEGYNGQFFRFEIKYLDFDDHYPATNQVWVDLDDNGFFENDEKFSMFSNFGTAYSNGIIYTNTVQAFYGGDGIINYKFHFADKYGYSPLPCTPLSNHTFTVTNTNISHVLTVTKNTNINGICDSDTNNVVMSVRIWDSIHPHTLSGFQVGNAGSMILGADFSNIQLWHDFNENHRWDITDILVAPLRWDGTDLWTNNNINYLTNLSFPGDFLVTIDLCSNAVVSNSFQSFIPADGVQCSVGSNAPVTALTNDGTMIIGPYLDVITNKGIQAVYSGFNNNTIMALKVTGSLQHTISGFKIGNAGNMVQGTDITNIRLWWDRNGNYSWDNADIYITNLIWNGLDLWTNNYIYSSNIIAPFLDIVVTADFKLTVIESNTFIAYIPKKGVRSSGDRFAPDPAITNNGIVTVGQFMGPVSFDFSLGSPSVAFGDINNNGFLDILAAGYNDPFRLLRKYINNGDSTFTGASAQTGVDRAALAMGDLNNDGYLDLVVAGEFTSLRWYLNDGTGAFVFKGSGNGVREGYIVLGDIDGDGDLDMVTSGNGGGQNRLEKYINDGSGAFTNTVKAFGVGLNQSSLALGDIDGDGDMDLIAGGSGRLDKYINNGSATNFTGPYPFVMGINSGSIVMGDIDGDGDLDFITSGSASGQLDKYVNNGAGSFIRTSFSFDFTASVIALGDIDNDGDLDFIVTGKNVNYLYKYINDGTGQFSSSTFGLRVGWFGGIDYRGSIAFGDIDNDNDLDLITAGSSTDWRPSGCLFNRYLNIERTVNNKPAAPASGGLGFTNIGGHIRLKWSAPLDDHTPQNMLRYKVAFGTDTGDYEFSSTNRDYPRGQADLGNAAVVTGTYYQTKITNWQEVYWKVCAIDSAYIASDFSEEHHTLIPRVHNITKGIDYYSISQAIAGADNNNRIQADEWTFFEAVTIRGFTNLILESTEWATNNVNLNTIISPIGFPPSVVKITQSKNVALRGFIIQRGVDGLHLDSGEDCTIANNYIFSNQADGIKIANCRGESVISNIITMNQGVGVRVNNTSFAALYRNAVYQHPFHGIALDNGDNCSIVNNSITSNASIGGSGVYLGNNSDNNIIKNNIITFSKSGYGIDLNSGSITNLTYNNVYGNSSGNYNAPLIPGIGSMTNDPLWYEYNMFSTNFLYLSNRSPCIDKGDPNDPIPADGNDQIDMGWKEFTRSYMTVELEKAITNITLHSNISEGIPGSTIAYEINLLLNSYGGLNGQNIIIYDRLDKNVTFLTDNTGSAGWSAEYSTNDIPDQSYNSLQYTNGRPQADKIKWVRWKKPTVSGGSANFYYKTIIR